MTTVAKLPHAHLVSTGPRRLKTGPATPTTATTVPHTTPWMVSRWPGSLGTLASTVPLSTSSTRGSWPVKESSKQFQTEPGEVHPPLTDSVGQAVHGLHHPVHHHPEGHQWSRQHHPERGEDSSAAKHHWPSSSPGDPEQNEIRLENVKIEDERMRTSAERLTGIEENDKDDKEDEDEDKEGREKEGRKKLELLIMITKKKKEYQNNGKKNTHRQAADLETSPVSPIPASPGKSSAETCSASSMGASESSPSPVRRKGRGAGGRGSQAINIKGDNHAFYGKISCETAPYNCAGFVGDNSTVGGGKTTALSCLILTDQWEGRRADNPREAALLATHHQSQDGCNSQGGLQPEQ